MSMHISILSDLCTERVIFLKLNGLCWRSGATVVCAAEVQPQHCQTLLDFILLRDKVRASRYVLLIAPIRVPAGLLAVETEPVGGWGSFNTHTASIRGSKLAR